MSLQFSEISQAPIGTDVLTTIERDVTGHAGGREQHRGATRMADLNREDVVMKLVAAFRKHPHINNVLTHICGSQWPRIEQAVRAIVSPATTPADLSPLAQNVVELMWAERGVTGRILKPYLRNLIARSLPHHAADQLFGQIARLCPTSAIASRHLETGPVAQHPRAISGASWKSRQEPPA
jgi:hypothetical protein